MNCINDKSIILEELEDAILPILLNAVNNKISIKEACNREGISYPLFKQTLKQTELAHKTAERQKIQEMKNEIRRISAEITTIIKSHQNS